MQAHTARMLRTEMVKKEQNNKKNYRGSGQFETPTSTL